MSLQQITTKQILKKIETPVLSVWFKLELLFFKKKKIHSEALINNHLQSGGNDSNSNRIC